MKAKIRVQSNGGPWSGKKLNSLSPTAIQLPRNLWIVPFRGIHMLTRGQAPMRQKDTDIISCWGHSKFLSDLAAMLQLTHVLKFIPTCVGSHNKYNNTRKQIKYSQPHLILIWSTWLLLPFHPHNFYPLSFLGSFLTWGPIGPVGPIGIGYKNGRRPQVLA